MDYAAILARVLQQVDEQAYLTPSSHIEPRYRPAMQAIEEAIQAPDLEAEAVRALIARLHAEGRIDRVLMLSALHVLACSPKVKDWAEAARLVGEQEFAALEQGGPTLEAHLAAVDRHRGVLAFLRGHTQVALDYFTRAVERQRTAENFGNVLCALVKLGDIDEATTLLAQIRAALPQPLVRELNERVARDPDLALLRSEVS